MRNRNIAQAALLAALIAAFSLIPVVAEAAQSPYCKFMEKYCPRLYVIYCK